MTPNFITQVFQNLQNVNSDNMNQFYIDKDSKLTAFFNKVPCICSGIGNIQNKYNQINTSNVFAFTAGVIRFKDQPTPLSTNIETTLATYNPTANITITCPNGSTTQYYVVAVLNQTQLDSYKVENAVTISNTAMTLAEIAAQSNPDAYAPIFTISNSGGVYKVGTDNNCAFNYNGSIPLHNFANFNRSLFLNNGQTYQLTTSDGFGEFSVVPSGNATLNANGHAIDFPLGFSFSFYSDGGRHLTINFITRDNTTNSHVFQDDMIHNVVWDGVHWFIDGQIQQEYSPIIKRSNMLSNLSQNGNIITPTEHDPLIIQWGIRVIPTQQVGVPVNFNFTFPNQALCVVPGIGYFIGGTPPSPSVGTSIQSKSTFLATINSNTSNNADFYFIAIGF